MMLFTHILSEYNTSYSHLLDEINRIHENEFFSNRLNTFCESI